MANAEARWDYIIKYLVTFRLALNIIVDRSIRYVRFVSRAQITFAVFVYRCMDVWVYGCMGMCVCV